MGEAMREMLRFIHADMNVKQINACIHVDNDKSIRLAEKCGFLYRGEMKDEVFRGKKYPHRIYSSGDLKARKNLSPNKYNPDQ